MGEPRARRAADRALEAGRRSTSRSTGGCWHSRRAVTARPSLLFGLAPAFGVSAVAPQEALKEQGRGITGGRRMPLRHALVIMQVALSLTRRDRRACSSRGRSRARHQGRRVRSRPGPDRGGQRDAQHLADRSADALFEQLRQAAAAVPGVATRRLIHVADRLVGLEHGRAGRRRIRHSAASADDVGQRRVAGLVRDLRHADLVAGRDVSHADSATGRRSPS